MDSDSSNNSKSDVVSKDTIYSELYTEMRRYRDYELTVSTWYVAILLAILSGIITIKYGAGFKVLFSECIVKVVFASVVTLIGLGCCYSVDYVSCQNRRLRKHVTAKLEPDWNKLEPNKTILKPNHIIIMTLLLLIAAIDIIILS